MTQPTETEETPRTAMDVVMEEVRKVVREELDLFAERTIRALLEAYREAKESNQGFEKVLKIYGIQEHNR